MNFHNKLECLSLASQIYKDTKLIKNAKLIKVFWVLGLMKYHSAFSLAFFKFTFLNLNCRTIMVHCGTKRNPKFWGLKTYLSLAVEFHNFFKPKSALMFGHFAWMVKLITIRMAMYWGQFYINFSVHNLWIFIIS